ncbi:hypothetical protein JQ615_36850 [Bradyrhizobium jicamae]|uniref:Uncharacterized protein n=1 Tax=Bradyrhizobium jicamae TaxID=280332 RepID=A0ABS5FVT7_9BRAD|nr:hypothetical protein [Bradyrhizobium jicamae]MBR0800947.1 hypothetical protein [Bradyrhizobium jicamae]
MSNALDHPDKLFARADAAIADSKRLAEEIIKQYDEVRAALRRRRLRAWRRLRILTRLSGRACSAPFGHMAAIYNRTVAIMAEAELLAQPVPDTFLGRSSGPPIALSYETEQNQPVWHIVEE